MRTVFLDSDYKCLVSPDGAAMKVETDFFDDKCDEFIAGHRFVPVGHIWVREDGVVFHGEMIAPWKDVRLLEAAQAEYEKVQAEMDDMRSALELLGVTPVG